MNRIRQRGFVLHLAVVIALLTMLWSVAAVQRVHHQTGATLHSYQKSEAYYLAKQAASRSLALLNSQQDWLDLHTGRDKPDTITPGAKAWVESGSGRLTLMVEASVSNKKHSLKIPILTQSDPSSKLFSLSPSQSGPDVVSWATTAAGVWEGLPPIPGISIITSVAVTKSGDVYAATEGPNSSILWRYRTGQGWVQMPDLRAGVELTQISCGGDATLVGKGSDNKLMKLPLGSTPGEAMAWQEIPAPSGTVIDRIKANPAGKDQTYITGKAGAVPKVFLHDGTSWNSHAAPSGVSNLEGGLTIDSDGNVFVASNSQTEGSPAIIYQRGANSAGDSSSEWTALAPVPAIEWVGSSAMAPSGSIQRITDIEADPSDGSLWVQWDSPAGVNRHNLVQVPTP